MGCDFPIPAWRTPHGSPTALTFNPMKALNSTNPLHVPCGKCTGCRLERSRQWAMRCMHEAQMHEHNSFITLTYSDDHLPIDGSISVRALQLFMKKLRKQRHPETVRFLACGEYGERNLRPHYHLLLFGVDWPDRKLYSRQKNGHWLYTSDLLSSLWPYGLAPIGELTFESAAYTARYSMKKIVGKNADAHYVRQHPIHGFFCRVKPEFLLMSRKPGLGATWLDKYKRDVFPNDEVIVNGFPTKPPRFYDEQLSEEDLDEIKRRRRKDALPSKPHNTNARRHARATVRDARIKGYKRNFGED